MKSLGLLILRIVVGGLLAGHGAQKLFGTFGGGGIEGTAAWLRSLRLRPARPWAIVAGASEFGGGLLTALGALTPLGSIAAIGSMAMATLKVHLGKPVWVTTGGAELPLTNMAALTALAFTGPGAISVDRILRIRVPWWMTMAAAGGVAGAVIVASGEEIAAGTSDLPAEMPGDPSTDADDAIALQAVGPGAMTTDRPELDVPSPGPADLEANELPREVGAFSMRIGESGADAGTAMGAGSDLGSETGDDRL